MAPARISQRPSPRVVTTHRRAVPRGAGRAAALPGDGLVRDRDVELGRRVLGLLLRRHQGPEHGHLALRVLGVAPEHGAVVTELKLDGSQLVERLAVLTVIVIGEGVSAVAKSIVVASKDMMEIGWREYPPCPVNPRCRGEDIPAF